MNQNLKLNTNASDQPPWFLILRDTNPEMVMAWLDAFSDPGPWSIGSGHIVQSKADAIVSPANSYGFMDGGIDLMYRNHFGAGLQNRLQTYLKEHFNGFLPVGQAILIPTLKATIPHMIVAPTMERPMNVASTSNAYLALRAALHKVVEYNRYTVEHNQPPIHRILVPGLATGIGGMNVDTSARQMRKAVDEVLAEQSVSGEITTQLN